MPITPTFANDYQSAAAAGLDPAFMELLSLLVRCPAVVGAEHSFFQTLQRELEERGARVTWYEGILVAQGAQPDSLFLSAHMDRHGLICTGPNEFQYAAFVSGARSDLLGNSVSELLMRKIEGRFTGQAVYAYNPWSGTYLGRGEITSTRTCEFRNNLIFNVSGLEHLIAGTPVAFLDKLKITDKALIAQLDNVLTVAALVYLFEKGFQGTVFFTAQEEAGKSWRYLLEWFRRFGGSTNQLVVVDTSPFPDFETAKDYNLVLRNRDANSAFSERLTRKLDQLTQELGIPAKYKDVYVDEQNAKLVKQNLPPQSLGSTEMGRIIVASKGLVTGTTLQIPTSGYHTMQETAPLSAVASFMTVLETLARSWS